MKEVIKAVLTIIAIAAVFTILHFIFGVEASDRKPFFAPIKEVVGKIKRSIGLQYKIDRYVDSDMNNTCYVLYEVASTEAKVINMECLKP